MITVDRNIVTAMEKIKLIAITESNIIRSVRTTRFHCNIVTESLISIFHLIPLKVDTSISEKIRSKTVVAFMNYNKAEQFL